MHAKWVFKHFSSCVQGRVPRFAIAWALGLLAGILLCTSASLDPYDAFQTTFSRHPSLLGRFFVCVLPVASIMAALQSTLFLFSYFVVFLWGISHGFCGFVIYTATGDAAWLLQPLLLFSAVSSSVLMWWIILQGSASCRIHKTIRLTVIFSCVIYCIDLFFISPFVRDLAKYF